MKNKIIVAYSIIISCVYLFAVSFFGYNLITEYSHGKERSKRKFDHIENTIKNNPSAKQLENAIGDLNDFAFLNISQNGINIFTYPENINYLPEESKLIKNFSFNNNDFLVNASIYLLRPITIYNSSRISFLIIFISTALTILLLIYINLFISPVSNSNEIIIDELEEISTKNQSSVLPADDNSTQISLEEKQNVIKQLSEITPDDINSSKTEEIITEIIQEKKDTDSKDEVLEKNSDDSKYNNTLPEDFSKPVEISETSNDLTATPQDTINIDTKEDKLSEKSDNNLEYRLDKEVSRAISSEIDISLLLIRIPELNKKETVASQIHDLLVEEFQYSDLVFDFNEDCYAGIKLNTNLDESITFADELNHKIINLLSDSNKMCFIGISSRTLRMVSAKRIILEAKEALVHAQQDVDSPIVAFRVDSEKYMKLMENN